MERIVFTAVKNDTCVHHVGKWVFSLLMMVARLEIFPVVVILRRSFWR